MSISIKDISKFYGSQAALNQVSFEIGKGEIVGFLGPNGAGKSTMMKIITCFIPPSKGTAEVCGFNVKEDPMEIKKRVGYLPESNPLYYDMYVKEYLRFVAGLHGIRRKKERVDEMISMVGLELEQSKKIGALSKGYKQRVGLAQAMIHDPEVLILDEPTSGLDPNQLEDIRTLIQAIGKEKTVMLSTHIMQEVEAICDRVIIINRGNIVANEDAKTIQKMDVKTYKVEFDSEMTKSQLMKVEGIKSCKKLSDTEWLIESISEEDIRKKVARFAQDNDKLILAFQELEQSMEEVFKKLTK